jgi:hypothetical protein
MLEMSVDRVSRRRLLRSLVVAGGSAALWSAASRPVAARAKAPKQVVQYRERPRGDQRCANCRYFLAEQSACERVKGDISPAAWCTLWAHIR